MEQCASCLAKFKVVVGEAADKQQFWGFTCPCCGYRFDVENIPKIVWVLDEYSGRWHTKLVNKYVTPDGVKYRRFDYFDLPGAGGN